MIANSRNSNDTQQRLAIAALIVVFFLVGYFGAGMATDPQRARSLNTPIDQRIPFIAGTVWFYLWSYSAALIPLFFVNCSRLFRRTAIAYCAAITISLICFLAFPVTSTQLRVKSVSLSESNFSEWAVLLVYSLDSPYNLFPSLHVSLTTLAAFSGWKADKFYGAIFYFGLGLVVISVCTVKQHFVLDVLAGLILGVLLGMLLLPSSSHTVSRPRTVWQGPVGYVLFLIVAYGSLYMVYRASQIVGIPTLIH